MTPPDEPLSVTRSVSVGAPAETLWEALSRPGELGAWLGGDVDLDVRPGGVGTAALPDGERSILVTEAEPGERLSWLWWRDDGDLSSVEFSLRPAGETTVVTVVERSCTVPKASASAAGSPKAGGSGAVASLEARLSRTGGWPEARLSRTGGWATLDSQGELALTRR